MDFFILNKGLCNLHLDQIMKISKDNSLLDWNEEKYLVDIQGKWKYSITCLDNKKLISYSINSSMYEGFIHIHRFCVEKSCQRTGNGILLLSQICKLAKIENKLISLNVHNDNKVAINFYSKFGFEIVKKDNLQSKMIYKGQLCQ